MVRSLVYESPTGGSVDLYSEDLWVGSPVDLRSRQYSYSLGFRRLSGVVRPAREVKLTALCRDPALLDAARGVFDADVTANLPGMLVVNGEWSQRCLFVRSETDMGNPVVQRVEFTVVLLDGAWSRPMSASYVPSVVLAGSGLDLPHDLPYDLTPLSLSADLRVESPIPVPVRLIIYGPATSPYVIIGGNRYEFDVTIPSGGYLTADGREGRKTITLTTGTGVVTNEFASGVRGGGEGSGEYCFEKLSGGLLPVSWSNSFGFDVTYWMQESELPWSTLQ